MNQADGVHVFFVDATDKDPVGTVATFRESDIATLSGSSSHLIQFSIDFKDGTANDTVKIYIDSKLVANGTTWEDYYRDDPEPTTQGNQVPTVDKLLFRESGTADSLNALKGFLVDRVTLGSSGAQPAQVVASETRHDHEGPAAAGPSLRSGPTTAASA
jgi:hypothetical protein